MSVDPKAADFILKGVNRGGRIGGVAGAIGGGLLSGLPKERKNSDGSVHVRSKGERISTGLLGAASGAYAGRSFGRVAGGVHNVNKWVKGHRPAEVRPDWLKKAKTKAEAKAAFRDQARKLHPDHGGNPSEFRKMHDEWKQHEHAFKTAMLSSFADELEKIASVGAILGGIAGYKVGPNTLRGKAVGTLVGAGLGHAAGAAGKAAKTQLVDEPHEREMRELYGYQPAAGYSY